MTARRILMLVCLFLAAVPLELASGQETLQEGLQEGGVDVDDLADATRLSEVRVHIWTTLPAAYRMVDILDNGASCTSHAMPHVSRTGFVRSQV